VVLLGFTSLFTDIGTEMIFPLLPVFLVETLQAGPTYLGLVEGAADTVASMLKLVSGVIADTVQRRKPLVLLGYGLASLVRPLVAVATHPWHVLAVRVTDRVGKGLRSSPRDALIADAAGERAGRAFGFHQAMDNVGAVFGPLLATALLAGHVPIRSIFWIAVIPGAIATVLAAIIRETPRRHAPAPALAPESSPASTPGPTTARALAPAPSPALAPAPSLATDKAGPVFGQPLRLYLAILALFSLGNSSDAFLLLRARSLGLTTAALPILWSVLNLSKVVWAYLGGALADRVPRARLIAVGWGVYGLVYFGLGAATGPWHVWALFVLYGVFYGLTEPVEKALVKDLARADARGRAYGAYNFIVGITVLPAGLLTGALWKVWGATLALDVGAAFAAIAAALVLTWDSWRAKHSGVERF
jgi:MFS family permease